MKRIGMWLLPFFLLFLMTPTISFGEENESPINVYPVYPENQLEGTEGYYHLQVQPGTEQTIYIEVENFTNQEQPILVYPINSFTGPTGGIWYEEKMNEEESRLLHPELSISKYISKKEVTIPPNKVERIPLTVKVPDVEGGTFIGAIRVGIVSPDKETEKTNNKDEANVVIENKITFTTAIQLDLPNDVSPNFSFGETVVRTTSTGRNLSIEMFNEAQMILRGTTGTYRVVYKDNELFKGNFEEFTMVPNSSIHFPVAWQGVELNPGEYHVFLTANVMGEEIEEVRTFTIEDEEVEKHEQKAEDFGLEQNQGTDDSIPIWIWIAGGGGLLFLLGFVYWLGTRKKHK